MEVSSSNLKFRISLVELRRLKPHERVISQLVKSLSDQIRSEGEVRDPLIVDDRDYVILDGMHRFNSLNELKCRFAPCCLVDYDNPMVKVESWFRMFDIKDSDAFAERLLTEVGLGYVKSKAAFNDSELSAEIILIGNRTWFNLTIPRNDVERAEIAAELEQSVSRKGYRVEYQPKAKAVERWRMAEASFVIPMPTFTNHRIRELGGGGILLPHKATCHFIPSRPLRLDIPLALLRNEDFTLDEANAELTKLLSGKKIDRKAPGAVIDGRRYEEELLIFTS